jgi:hypothetical protein
MDFGRFIQVAWRFRLLLGIGLVLATLAALMSFARIGLDGGKPSVTPRESPTYVSASTVLVTQSGFPWGRAILDDMIEAAGGGADGAEPVLIPKYGDPGRYSGLAAIYAELAKGDAVQRRAMQGAKPGEYYETMVVQQPGQATGLPMIYFKGYGPSPDAAVMMAQRSSKAFIAYLDEQQASSGIPESKRVEVVITQTATAPTVFLKRSFVRPVVLFLLVSMIFLALAFGFENLRPRARRRSGQEALADLQDLRPQEPEPLSARRSA